MVVRHPQSRTPGILVVGTAFFVIGRHPLSCVNGYPSTSVLELATVPGDHALGWRSTVLYFSYVACTNNLLLPFRCAVRVGLNRVISEFSHLIFNQVPYQQPGAPTVVDGELGPAYK